MKYDESKLSKGMQIKIALLRQTIAIERKAKDDLEMMYETYLFGLKK